MIKVTIVGAAGRMGQTLIRCMHHFPRLRLVGAVESDQCPVLGNDAGIVAGIERAAPALVVMGIDRIQSDVQCNSFPD